jgi:Arc/MetJ family transcription regulator
VANAGEKAAANQADRREAKRLPMGSSFAILRSMKTTVDIPEKDLAEVMRHTHAKTKTEAVAKAVADFNRRQRLAKLADKLGTFKGFMTLEDLRKMRETD